MKQDIICPGQVTEETLGAAVAEFLLHIRPQRERLLDYYRGEQPVPKGEAVRGRPNNLLRVPFPRYITEVHTGYFLGLPPTLAFPAQEDTKAFSQLERQLRLNSLLFEIAVDMSVCGAGYALVWLERQGLRLCRCDPLSCFALRSNTADRSLLATVRLFQTQKGVTEGVAYLPDVLRSFTWENNQLTWGAAEENLLGTIPLLPFYNNAEGCGDFEAVTGLVDAYNLLLSGAMDDMQSVANAFLALYGMQGTTQDDIDQANRTRVLSLSEGGRAEFVVKNLNQEALAQLETNLRQNILQLSMTPDLSDESFAGATSGIALQYKLWGIEQVRSAKERSFSASLTALLRVLAAGLTVLGTPVTLEGGMTFYKNLPQNNAELAETLMALEPVLSRRTILEQLPWVTDAEEELKRKAAEQSAT